MRKIAHILETPLESHGGLNVLARELAAGLVHFYGVYVFCPEMGSAPAQKNCPTTAFAHLPWKAGALDGEILGYLKNMIREHHIDLLVFHGGDFSWGPGKGRLSLITKLSALGVVCIFVNHQSTPLFRNLPTLRNPKNRPSLKSTAKFAISWCLKAYQLHRTKFEITVSKFEEAQARKRFFFWRSKVIQIYHSRISHSWQRAGNSADKNKTVLSMGHFAFRKGQHVLLAAFGRIAAKHPQWKLQLVGSSGQDEYWQHLCQLIEHYQVHSQVELVTETLHPDSYFKKASIYVQPSLVEAYGLALQEAMSFGCACVGSDSGGIRDSIINSRLLYPAGDDKALAAILDRLMSDALLIEKCQDSARTDTLNLNRNHDQMIKDYRRIIDKCFEESI